MKLKWYGHSCFGLTFANGTAVVTDPFDETVGYPLCAARADIALLSHAHFDHNHVQSLAGNPQVIRTPGVHEAGGLRITGTPTFHDPEGGKLRGPNVIFSIEGDGLRIVHMGDIGHIPTDGQYAAIEGADVMLIPIGGTYTVTTPQAVEIIRRAKPRMAVAMHFSNDLCKMPIADASEFIRLTGAVEMPGEIEIAPGADLPRAIVMRYEA